MIQVYEIAEEVVISSTGDECCHLREVIRALIATEQALAEQEAPDEQQ